MKHKFLWINFTLLFLALTVKAETVHLNSGESIEGKIIRVEAESISVESSKGFGVIHVNRSDISLIEFDQKSRGMSRKIGIGYYHRSSPSSVGAISAEYGVDALSMKMWLSDTDSVDIQLGFYSFDDSVQTKFSVFSLDARYAMVFTRKSNLDVYMGGSVGYLNVKDTTLNRNVSDTGTSLRAFLGVEMFFVTLPNLGISSEIGLGFQTVGNVNTTNLSTTTFPSFSIRYYY